MIKTMILLATLFMLNGCTSLPKISDKSNSMLHQDEWENINTEDMKRSIK